MCGPQVCVCGRGLVILRGEHLDMFFLVCCGCCHCLPQSVSVCVLLVQCVRFFMLLFTFCFLRHCVVFRQICETEIIPGPSHGQNAMLCGSRWRLRCHTWLHCNCRRKNRRFSLKHLVPVRILRTASGSSSSGVICCPWLPSLKWSL